MKRPIEDVLADLPYIYTVLLSVLCNLSPILVFFLLYSLWSYLK